MENFLRDSQAQAIGATARAVAAALSDRPALFRSANDPADRAAEEREPARGQVERALIGVSSTQWRGTRDRDVAILSAAQPIFVGDDIVGAVVLEETTASIQLLKTSALENLLGVTLGVVAASLAILLAFSTRLVARIRKLHAETESAIDAQ